MEFSAWGKLMLFGEYLVLRGSNCISLPLKFGQKATIVPQEIKMVNWTSLELGKEWFSASFDQNIEIIFSTDTDKAQLIQKLLRLIKTKNKQLFSQGWTIEIESDFPREWGFGSSSTLISLLAQWSKVDPYFLLEETFGGSGFDVATATSMKPIVYNTEGRIVESFSLDKEITSKLLFVYSGKKQKSKEEVERFSLLNIPKEVPDEMNTIISEVRGVKNIEDFETLMNNSEELLSDVLGTSKIKDQYFDDYPHSIKSLGAWGGDFFMATYRDENKARSYFDDLGFKTQFNYSQLTYPNA